MFNSSEQDYSVWADWHVPSTQTWFTNELKIMNENTPFDGIWIDLNEPSNFDNVLASNLHNQDMLGASNDSRNLNFPPYRINK